MHHARARALAVLGVVAALAGEWWAHPRPDGSGASHTGSRAAAGGDDEGAGAGDPLRGRQWALDDLRLPQAWRESEGKGAIVAVVDSGVDLHHPDLRRKLVPGQDFIDGDGAPQDEYGHGTHLAGIAAADTGNRAGIAGAAPDAMLMPVRVLDAEGYGENSTIAEGIVWAVQHGADVVDLSLNQAGLGARRLAGGPIDAAMVVARRHRALVVASAGNDGRRRRAYRLGAPVLVVGASDQTDRAAPFTNTGDGDAVSAPGVRIESTLPTIPVRLVADGSGYGTLDGTSMAAAYVAGVAALLMARRRDPVAAADAIRATARNPHGDRRLGRGIVDARAALSRVVSGR